MKRFRKVLLRSERRRESGERRGGRSQKYYLISPLHGHGHLETIKIAVMVVATVIAVVAMVATTIAITVQIVAIAIAMVPQTLARL